MQRRTKITLNLGIFLVLLSSFLVNPEVFAGQPLVWGKPVAVYEYVFWPADRYVQRPAKLVNVLDKDKDDEYYVVAYESMDVDNVPYESFLIVNRDGITKVEATAEYEHYYNSPFVVNAKIESFPIQVSKEPNFQQDVEPDADVYDFYGPLLAEHPHSGITYGAKFIYRLRLPDKYIHSEGAHLVVIRHKDSKYTDDVVRFFDDGRTKHSGWKLRSPGVRDYAGNRSNSTFWEVQRLANNRCSHGLFGVVGREFVCGVLATVRTR